MYVCLYALGFNDFKDDGTQRALFTYVYIFLYFCFHVCMYISLNLDTSSSKLEPVKWLVGDYIRKYFFTFQVFSIYVSKLFNNYTYSLKFCYFSSFNE